MCDPKAAHVSGTASPIEFWTWVSARRISCLSRLGIATAISVTRPEGRPEEEPRAVRVVSPPWTRHMSHFSMLQDIYKRGRRGSRIRKPDDEVPSDSVQVI